MVKKFKKPMPDKEIALRIAELERVNRLYDQDRITAEQRQYMLQTMFPECNDGSDNRVDFYTGREHRNLKHRPRI